MDTPPIIAALAADEAAIAELLLRLDTSALQQGDMPTKALIVLNPGDQPFSGVAVFHAAFPVRTPLPVTVWDSSGSAPSVLFSRLANETRGSVAEDGKRLWTFDLQFVVTAIPPRGGAGFAATFGASPHSEASPGIWEEMLCRPCLQAYETDCHSGDLVLPFHVL